MMDKKEFVQSLEGVKLVLGNGFDLHCRLHSSYKDYLNKQSEYFNYLRKLITEYKKQFNECRPFYKNGTFNNESVDKINAWDLVFASLSSDKDYYWFDIEKEIQRSLSDDNYNIGISFPRILQAIQEKKINESFLNDLFASFLVNKYGLKNIYHSIDFYNCLLDELKKFEQNFGLFIQNQRINVSNRCFMIGLENERFTRCANATINLLCSREHVVSVDNFNYDDCGIEEFANIERNINGDINAPIFGIDSVYDPEDNRIIFTKTHRRISDDMNCEETLENKPFKNLIIYGHSLDEADYSYFFPIFDSLRLTDNTADGVIVFCFSIYDESKEEYIRKTFNRSIYRILEAYALYKGYSNAASVRLVDFLSIQKRIIMYEIPEINDRKLIYKNLFDLGFEDAEK